MRYRLENGTRILAEGGGLVLRHAIGDRVLPCRDPGVADRLLTLESGVEVECLLSPDDSSPTSLAETLACLATVASVHALVREVELGGRVVARMRPCSAAAELGAPPALDGVRYRLSRFTIMRSLNSGLVLESPLAHGRLEVHDPAMERLLLALLRPCCAADLGELDPTASPRELRHMLGLLAAERLVGAVDEDDKIDEDGDPTLRQWEPHDLYFHSRSRLGRHIDPVGGNFPFRGQLPPQPCVKPLPDGPRILLPVPTSDPPPWRDPPFFRVLEARTSVRAYVADPLTLDQLGEFLWRAARNRGCQETEVGTLASRPYPSGGASYELETYVTVDCCLGLERGFYYYAPNEHALVWLRPACEDTMLLLRDAHRATAGHCWPQVLFTFAARFQRVAWKYQSMAYATILKNVGALYQTLYLVATAMGLAPCALGIGDAMRFCRLAGTDYFQESSVGEFALGTGGVLDSGGFQR